MVVTDSEEIPEDFPLIEFAMLMGEFGRIQAQDYQRAREVGIEALRNGPNVQGGEALPLDVPTDPSLSESEQAKPSLSQPDAN